MPIVRESEVVPGPVSYLPSRDEEFDLCITSLRGIEERNATGEDPLPLETLEDTCREQLELPWYYRTDAELFVRWLDRHTAEIACAVVAILVAAVAYRYRRPLLRAANRALYALTGADARRVLRRWRAYPVEDQPRTPPGT